MFSEISDESLLVFILWLIAMLILWNMHRYANFLTRKKMVATIAAISFLFFAIAWSLDYRDQISAKKYSKRVAIFAMPVTDIGEPSRLQPESIAIAELAGKAITADTSTGFYAYPIDWLYETVNPDSATSADYLRRVASRLRYPYCIIGFLQTGKDSSTCRYSIFKADKANPLLQSQFIYPDGNVESGALQLAREIGAALHLKLQQFTAPKAVSTAYYEMRLALLLGERKKARKNALAIIADDSSNVEVWKSLAQISFYAPDLIGLGKKVRQRKLARVTEKLANLSDLDTTNATLARLAAKGFYWREKFNEAAQYTLRAFRHSPYGDSKVLNQLAKLHFSRYRPLGFLNEIEIYSQALQCNPGDIEAVLELAAVQIQLKHTVKAQALVEKYYAIFPANLRILRALGEIYVMRGLAAKIFKTYDKILQHDPNDTGAYYNLGIYYFNNEDTLTATKFFKKAVKVGNHLNSRLYLAKIAEKQHRIDAAIAYLRQRIRLKTGEDDVYAEEARRHLLEMMLALGKIDSTGKVIE